LWVLGGCSGGGVWGAAAPPDPAPDPDHQGGFLRMR
jgi:hypothetical protein